MFPNDLWFTTDVTWWRRRARPVPVYISLILHFLPPGQCGLFDAPPGRMFSQHPQHRDESTVTLFLKLCSWRKSCRCPAGLHRGDHSILREKRFKGARAAGRTWLKTCTLSVLLQRYNVRKQRERKLCTVTSKSTQTKHIKFKYNESKMTAISFIITPRKHPGNFSSSGTFLQLLHM